MKRRQLFQLAFATLLACTGSAALAEQVYSFGIVPQSTTIRTAKDWSPILKYLEDKTGLKFRFATARNIQTFSKRVAEERFDFIYMNPTDYVKYQDSDGYVAFARARNLKIRGIIVVRKDSPIETLEELAKHDIAVPANAFAADVIPRAVLREKGIDVQAHPVAAHDVVYRAVAQGRYTAGGGVMRSFSNAPAEYRDQLRVLWTSDEYTPHAFTAHARVPKEIVKLVQETLIDMSLDPVGVPLLKSIAPEGLENARDEDWDDVRNLDI